MGGFGWEKEISKHLGMELDEVIRLKQITGLKEMFANHEFSKSWEEFEENRKKRKAQKWKKDCPVFGNLLTITPSIFW